MIRLAVAGAGYMASNHARVANESGRAKLVLVVDVDADRARALAEAHGAGWSTDVDALGDADADVAVVACATEAHAQCALPLLEAGVPTLVEKPLGPDLATAEAIIHIAARTGTPVTCGFVERFNPVVAAARAQLSADPLHFHAVRHSPAAPRIRTSVIHDLLIHDADLAVQFGLTAVVHTCGTTWHSPSTHAVELADALVTFESGMVANLSASRSGQRKIREIRLSTPNELIELDLLRQDITVYRNILQEQAVGETINYREQTTVDIPFVRHGGEPLLLQFAHFLALASGEIDVAGERESLLPAHVVAESVEALSA